MLDASFCLNIMHISVLKTSVYNDRDSDGTKEIV